MKNRLVGELKCLAEDPFVGFLFFGFIAGAFKECFSFIKTDRKVVHVFPEAFQIGGLNAKAVLPFNQSDFIPVDDPGFQVFHKAMFLARMITTTIQRKIIAALCDIGLFLNFIIRDVKINH